eukprot:TRINITY_DN1915_c0_g1_i1.p1 TRINITY_DN1915_c0_g1~~TRINITY_DN1915_c0_g1_i1.p1  ORF type:complete len:384 (-),score=71.71 TRINITY_DN1915_c0_g1_i1:262-1413(-)
MAAAAEVPAPIVDVDIQLLAAAKSLDLDEVARLLESGASAKYVESEDGTWGARKQTSALHEALLAGRRGSDAVALKAVVTKLLNAGANVNALWESYDWRGCGSSKTAFEMLLPMAMDDPTILELALTCGGNANTSSTSHTHSMRTDGSSTVYIIHNVARGGNLEAARALLDAGAEVDAIHREEYQNERGYDRHVRETALHIACSTGNVAMCALLLAAGANVDAIRQDLVQEPTNVASPTDDPRDDAFISSVRCVRVDETALHIALRQRNASLTTMLVCAGADRSIARSYGSEAITCEEMIESITGGDEDGSTADAPETSCKADKSTMLKALKTEWCPETHKLFPPDVRQCVETALKIAKRQEWPFPDTVLFRICALAAGPSSS